MSLEYLTIFAVIAVLSVVQSFFGMGLLIFGTPTLLLMGYAFIATLGYLLPASFAISMLQVLLAGSNRILVSRYLYLFCLPGIGLGLLLSEFSSLDSWTNILVGVTLLFSALVRFMPMSQRLFTTILERHLLTYHLVMGAIHGMTNLGGALLAILAGGLNTEKEAIRYTIAHYYLAFSAVQMFLLATFMGHHDTLIASLPAAGISAAVYLLVGNRIFNYTSNQFYKLAMTLFITSYGIIVLLKFVVVKLI